jgi:hypothetical protein
VIPDLRGVVEDTARRLLDDFFQRQVLEFGARNQVVQVRDVGLVVLAVVELERLFGHVRSERVLRVRQRRERMLCHGADPSVVYGESADDAVEHWIVGDLE